MSIMLQFIGSIEFYAIAFGVAVAVIAIIMRPSDKGEALTYFARGEMMPSASGEELLSVWTDSYGRLRWRRYGVALDTDDCQVNCAVTVAGSDISIIERRTANRLCVWSNGIVDITFEVDEPLCQGRYHLHYESEWTSKHCSGTLRVPCAVERSFRMTL